MNDFDPSSEEEAKTAPVTCWQRGPFFVFKNLTRELLFHLPSPLLNVLWRRGLSCRQCPRRHSRHSHQRHCRSRPPAFPGLPSAGTPLLELHILSFPLFYSNYEFKNFNSSTLQFFNSLPLSFRPPHTCPSATASRPSLPAPRPAGCTRPSSAWRRCR